MTAISARIRSNLVGLRMPRALEVLDHVFQRLEAGEITAIEALDELLNEEFISREGRRVSMALMTARLAPIKTLESSISHSSPHWIVTVSWPWLNWSS